MFVSSFFVDKVKTNMGSNRIAVIIIFVFGYGNCNNTNTIGLNDNTSDIFNKTWIQHSGLEKLCKFNILQQHVDNQRWAECFLNIHKLCTKLDKNVTTQNLLNELYHRDKRNDEEKENDLKFSIPKEFLIQIVQYFQIKELLFVIDKTNLTG